MSSDDKYLIGYDPAENTDMQAAKLAWRPVPERDPTSLRNIKYALMACEMTPPPRVNYASAIIARMEAKEAIERLERRCTEAESQLAPNLERLYKSLLTHQNYRTGWQRLWERQRKKNARVAK